MRNRLKVAICITRFDPGGQGVVLLEIAKRLKEQFDLTLFAEGASRPVPAWLPYTEIKAWRHRYVPLVNNELVKQLRQYDVVHCHDSAGFMDAAIKSGTPTIVTAHGIYPWNLRWGLGAISVVDGLISELAYGLFYRRVSLVIAISPYVQRWLKARYGVDSLEIPNGVDLETFVPCAASTEKQRGGPVMYFAGEVSARKGVDEIVAAIPALRSRFPDINLRISGHGKPKFIQWMERYTHSQGIRDSVTFLGNLSAAEVAGEMRSADVFVTGSRCEGFALPVIEAMACGTPAVVFAGTATLDHITASAAGEAFQGGSAGFADAVSRCLQASSEEISTRARNYAGRFDWRIIAEKYAEQIRRFSKRSA